jgi:hypothetical protein
MDFRTQPFEKQPELPNSPAQEMLLPLTLEPSSMQLISLSLHETLGNPFLSLVRNTAAAVNSSATALRMPAFAPSIRYNSRTRMNKITENRPQEKSPEKVDWTPRMVQLRACL